MSLIPSAALPRAMLSLTTQPELNSEAAMASVYELIREAILHKRVVVANYRRDTLGVRFLCPHAIGTKNGTKQAIFYQFAGGSETKLGPTGSLDNWRCMLIEYMEDVAIVDGDWHTADNWNRDRQHCIDVIDAEVARTDALLRTCET